MSLIIQRDLFFSPYSAEKKVISEIWIESQIKKKKVERNVKRYLHNKVIERILWEIEK